MDMREVNKNETTDPVSNRIAAVHDIILSCVSLVSLLCMGGTTNHAETSVCNHIVTTLKYFTYDCLNRGGQDTVSRTEGRTTGLKVKHN